MYNGIGLLTPRGSGTSGYVQTNKFNLRGPPPMRVTPKPAADESGPPQRQPNKDILDHNRKREIELKLAKEQARLEDEGWTAEQIANEIADLRKKEFEKLATEAAALGGAGDRKLLNETHEVAQRKLEQMDKLKAALGISEVKEGEAFDRELQEKKKLERLAEKEAKEREREKERKQREKEKKRKAKEQKKRVKELAKAKEQWEKRVAASEARGAQGREARRDDGYRGQDPRARRAYDEQDYRERRPYDGDDQPRYYRKGERPPDRYDPQYEEEDRVEDHDRIRQRDERGKRTPAKPDEKQKPAAKKAKRASPSSSSGSSDGGSSSSSGSGTTSSGSESTSSGSSGSSSGSGSSSSDSESEGDRRKQADAARRTQADAA
eukprot:CAMPEP_0202909188 /NCGR_PEP_ID=MMETSP1392-20130828/48598_1 /ASSEMBLY_ACC=CAM_ASM_000868 /TAXON_ID=225041 /ORGANISM="Chlamydomonas chlamydogama, Strain SAG 11-48b" /LENGTH=378 /DNA_ID=CAMNT_0049598863 /DNA_START=101 /DNA_END=1233 /DNA_ORIENTATION=-